MKMDGGARNSWQVRAAALLIFLLGAVAGTLAPRAYYKVVGRPGGETRRGGSEQMFDRLQLTTEQRTQVRQIFADTRGQLVALRKESEPRVVEIRRQADERLQQVLTPEQWQRFQQMKAEMRGRGRRGGRDRGEPASH